MFNVEVLNKIIEKKKEDKDFINVLYAKVTKSYCQNLAIEDYDARIDEYIITMNSLDEIQKFIEEFGFQDIFYKTNKSSLMMEKVREVDDILHDLDPIYYKLRDISNK